MKRTAEENAKLKELRDRAYEAFQDHLMAKAQLMNARANLKNRQKDLILQGDKGPITGRNEMTREAQLREETGDLIAKTQELELDTRSAWVEAWYHQSIYRDAQGYDVSIELGLDDQDADDMRTA